MIKIDIDDTQVLAALNRLIDAGTDLRPAMEDIGEYLVDSTRRRFQRAEAPDGTPWAPNSQTTILQYLDKFSSSYSKKTGKISSAGANRTAGKKPLTGETKQLSTKIYARVTDHSVDVGSPLEYAGTQQFGAKKGSFTGGKSPWGDIPARPFLGLSNDDKVAVLDILQEHLSDALSGG
jgi:phage virion morphogenesis protein